MFCVKILKNILKIFIIYARDLDVYIRISNDRLSALKKINLIYFHPAVRVIDVPLTPFTRTGGVKGCEQLFLSLKGTR